MGAPYIYDISHLRVKFSLKSNWGGKFLIMCSNSEGVWGNLKPELYINNTQNFEFVPYGREGVT